MTKKKITIINFTINVVWISSLWGIFFFNSRAVNLLIVMIQWMYMEDVYLCRSRHYFLRIASKLLCAFDDITARLLAENWPLLLQTRQDSSGYSERCVAVPVKMFAPLTNGLFYFIFSGDDWWCFNFVQFILILDLSWIWVFILFNWTRYRNI